MSMFSEGNALPWMTSNAAVVSVAGYDESGKATDAMYVPYNKNDSLFTQCHDHDLQGLLDWLRDNASGFTDDYSKAIAVMISVVTKKTVDPKDISDAVAKALDSFKAFVDAYDPAKMDVYRCSTKELIETRGGSSKGALGWIGNVRQSLSHSLTEVTNNRVKRIDALTRDEIVKAWERSFPGAGGKKKTLLLDFFQNASDTAVQRMIMLLIGPGPDFAQNDGTDTVNHFKLANQVSSLGIQQTDDAAIHTSASAWLQNIFHHDQA
jgi:hypothetical protein